MYLKISESKVGDETSMSPVLESLLVVYFEVYRHYHFHCDRPYNSTKNFEAVTCRENKNGHPARSTEKCTLLGVLKGCCREYPRELRRKQLVMGVDNRAAFLRDT